ncbi:hypothetical protein [uncultured Maritimibacter sp.]|jgi:hypothetical protein|uniref:DUF5983 family protein n=1 Tax=uncultured Maritimibacter sp. TaxID=991866 RepID=UPI00261ECAE3|nr:hypothetical protein [uncultured Maritimibacter sp.]
MMRNVRRFYDCSTAHLPEQTVQAIENGLFARSPSMRNEYGWLFSVPETLADMPEGVDCDAFKAVMALAMDAGCDYVLFDRDVPPVAYLEVFGW